MTHAVVGAVTARAGMRKPRDCATPGAALLLAGALGGLLPDLDRLIHSAADPLLHIEFHRHFTHALAFIPLGGLLAALPWMLIPRLRPYWRPLLVAATLGYATHGLLDASTTYGTLLLWPFGGRRIAWHLISIVDPVFTGIALVGLVTIWRHPKSRTAAVVTLAACATYLAVGAWQRDRASEVQRLVAVSRGHSPVRGAVFPGFATQVIWRSLYEADGRYYMDRIRVPWTGTPTWSPGAAATPVAQAELPAGDPRVRHDFARFQWFTGGWAARSVVQPSVIGDARYSLATDRFEPVWGVRFHPGQHPPVEWVDHSRGRRVDLRVWQQEVRGRDPAFRAVPGAAHQAP